MGGAMSAPAAAPANKGNTVFPVVKLNAPAANGSVRNNTTAVRNNAPPANGSVRQNASVVRQNASEMNVSPQAGGNRRKSKKNKRRTSNKRK
jgi:hypothetical protein